MSKIAIVILNWNGQKLLEQFLPSVVKHSENTSIYVIDNASTDTSISFVEKNFPEIKIIENTANYGYAKGYNNALKQIDEPYFALVNSDVEVTQNWLAPIIELFDNDSAIDIIQPKILDYKNKDYYEYAGAGGGFIDKYGYPFCRGRIFNSIEKDNAQYNDTTEIFWASGACFFIRKNVFENLGGFDEDFFAHQEEIDLCWRAKNLGSKIYYCGTSEIYHVGGATLNYNNPQKTYLNFRNSLLMLLKNLPAKSLFPIIFSRLVLDGVAGIKFFLNGQPKHCFAVVHSHFGFYKRFIKFYKKRNTYQIKKYYKVKNIVFQYFIKKRINFFDII